MERKTIDLLISIPEQPTYWIIAPDTLKELLEMVSRQIHLDPSQFHIMYERRGNLVKIIDERTYSSIISRSISSSLEEISFTVQFVKKSITALHEPISDLLVSNIPQESAQASTEDTTQEGSFKIERKLLNIPRRWVENDPQWMDSESNPKINSISAKKKLLCPKLTMKSHVDGIRGIHFFNSKAVLASGSEDCMIKLWDLRNLKNETEVWDPYLTLRGHVGSILALAGGYSWGSMNINENLLYSAGTEGVIKIWKIPHPDSIDNEISSEGETYCLGTWTGHNDAIWSLNHSQTENALISASSDGSVLLWRALEISRLNENLSSGRRHAPSSIFNIPNEVPTSCAWVQTNLQYIAVGYNSNALSIFNRETSRYFRIPYAGELQRFCHQVNQLISSSANSLLIAAHDDKRIRFYDINSNSCIKDMVAHTDSVTTVSVDKSGFYLISGGHDGSLRSWDLRKFQCLQELPVHRKKYDEAVHIVTHHPTLPLLASGGADCLVKLFEFK